jgi:hypothetical protein
VVWYCLIFFEAIVNGIVPIYFSMCSLLVYRKATEFCKLILYSAALRKLFPVSRSFQVEFFWSLRYKIMSSRNRHSLTTSLPIFIPFISSSCLISLARNSRAILTRIGEGGHPCLIPEFRGNGFRFSLSIMMVAIGLWYIAFIMLRYIPSIPNFLYHEVVLNLIKCFFCIYWDDQVVFVFASINVLY